jgi:hypothetical protein
MDDRCLEIRVPADASYDNVVEYVVGDAARRAGIPPDRAAALTAAALAGFRTIVERAMDESCEPVRIVLERTATHVSVELFERGVPIDDALARRDGTWASVAQGVDDARWRLHGTAGSELHLAVRLHDRDHARRKAAPVSAEAVDAVPLAPPQAYTIRRFEPGDAAGIARAFYATYGYHYDFPAVYEPAKLCRLNAAGTYVSIVAVAQDGEIAGHYALAREGDEPIADGCGAVVLPAHRGRNLLNELRAQAEREAVGLGLAAYYSEPVTDHGRTQHASETFGASVCAVTLGSVSRNFLAKHLELSNTTQRQSFMLYVKPLRPRVPRTIFVPERHRATVASTYARLGFDVAFGERGTDANGDSGEARVRSAIVRADGIGTIVVERAGRQAAECVRQCVEDLRSITRLGGIYASLSLEDPGTPDLCEALESFGFFYSGVGPYMHDGADSLRLQMPLTPIDISALTIASEAGKQLVAYVAAERERVGSRTLRFAPERLG